MAGRRRRAAALSLWLAACKQEEEPVRYPAYQQPYPAPAQAPGGVPAPASAPVTPAMAPAFGLSCATDQDAQ